jgi:putative acyl-CoA dehydrogenase
MGRQPESVTAFFDEVEKAGGGDRRLDASAAALKADTPDATEGGARRLVERMALVLQGSLLVRFGHPAVADAFCASRLGGDGGRAFGTLPPGLDVGTIVDRARPKVS